MKGWHKESHRHYLAAKGISTYRFKKATRSNSADIISQKRFGEENIKRMKKLGSGRDRVVYDLGEGSALKVAKNPGGLTQNTTESWIDEREFKEDGQDYVVVEKLDKPGQATKKAIKELESARDRIKDEVSKKYADEYKKGSIFSTDQYRLRDRIQNEAREKFFESPEFQKYMPEGSENYGDFNLSDIFRKSQWGEKEGKPVLADTGVLLQRGELRDHRVKDFRASNRTLKKDAWQLNEWEDIKQKRAVERRKNK